MNGDGRGMSAERFAGLSRAAFARNPQMTVILARRASAVYSICYTLYAVSLSLYRSKESCIVNKLTAIIEDL